MYYLVTDVMRLCAVFTFVSLSLLLSVCMYACAGVLWVRVRVRVGAGAHVHLLCLAKQVQAIIPNGAMPGQLITVAY